MKKEDRYKKPEWLRKKISLKDMQAMKNLLSKDRLHTICEEAMCPNISECFSHNQATFLILGNICTRSCTYCNVTKGMPIGVDDSEPEKIAKSVEILNLRHVVITSPARDDLPDEGANQFLKVTKAIKTIDKDIRVELLIPDFHAKEKLLETVANSGAEIIGHNLETVPRLYTIRKGSNYKKSLRVLKKLKEINPDIKTKSGIMVGLGEKKEEVFDLMQDLLNVGCKLLSIGQYLAPSKEHTPVIEYIRPEIFELYKEKGMKMGFDHIQSSPYTRSSYLAHEYI